MIPLVAVLLVTSLVFESQNEPGSNVILILVYGSVSCLSALLFIPLDSNFSIQSFLTLASRCAVSMLVFVLATQIDSQARVNLVQIMPSAVLIFLISLSALCAVLASVRHRSDARQIVFVFVASLFATPLWLGTLAEVSGNLPAMTNMIIGASPLSALSVALDFDYLRTSWFYKNTVLGSLRYEYFSWAGYALALTAIVAGFAFGATGAKFHRITSLIRRRITTS